MAKKDAHHMSVDSKAFNAALGLKVLRKGLVYLVVVNPFDYQYGVSTKLLAKRLGFLHTKYPKVGFNIDLALEMSVSINHALEMKEVLKKAYKALNYDKVLVISSGYNLIKLKHFVSALIGEPTGWQHVFVSNKRTVLPIPRVTVEFAEKYSTVTRKRGYLQRDYQKSYFDSLITSFMEDLYLPVREREASIPPMVTGELDQLKVDPLPMEWCSAQVSNPVGYRAHAYYSSSGLDFGPDPNLRFNYESYVAGKADELAMLQTQYYLEHGLYEPTVEEVREHISWLSQYLADGNTVLLQEVYDKILELEFRLADDDVIRVSNMQRVYSSEYSDEYTLFEDLPWTDYTQKTALQELIEEQRHRGLWLKNVRF